MKLNLQTDCGKMLDEMLDSLSIKNIRLKKSLIYNFVGLFIGTLFVGLGIYTCFYFPKLIWVFVIFVILAIIVLLYNSYRIKVKKQRMQKMIASLSQFSEI